MQTKRTSKAGFRSLLPRFREDGEPLFHRTLRGIDPTLLLMILLLAAAGTVTIFSAGSAYAENRYHNGYYFIERQIVWVVIGVCVMLFSLLPSSRFWYAAAPALYCITVLLLLAVLAVGIAGNGAQRWIGIGPLTFQPSEFAKTALILILSRYYADHHARALDRKNRKNAFLYGTLFPFLLIGLICVLVLLQKHLSGLIILGCIGLLVMLFSGISLRYIGAFGGVCGVGVTLFACLTDYTKRRITIWLNPEQYPLDGGWQTLQGLMAIGSGGFFGRGFGNSVLKYSYVSEPANDMIYTILCEETGFLGAAGVVVLFSLFVFRAVKVGSRCSDPFPRLVALGIAGKIAVQVLLNLAVVTNTIPNTGISLPFFSYGGSSLVMLFFEMGVLLSISREVPVR